MNAQSEYQSPCVGLCTTTFGDRVCRGCHRFAHEVDGWNGYPPAWKAAVMRRIEQYRLAVLSEAIEIVDQQLFEQALVQRQVRIDRLLHPACWVFELLRFLAHESVEPAACGLRLRSDSSLSELWQQLNDNLYQTSQEYYRRYFALSSEQ